MAGTNWITAGNGSRPEMDRGRKWIAAGDGSRPERDDSGGFATTLTANYRTGSAGTKHRETHSPIEETSSGKCTWRRINNYTLRTAKSACREVMANAPTDESRSHMSKSQSRMRSRLSLGDPDSVSAIPTQSRQSRDTQLLLEIDFRINPSQSIWHAKKP